MLITNKNVQNHGFDEQNNRDFKDFSEFYRVLIKFLTIHKMLQAKYKYMMTKIQRNLTSWL